MRGVHPADEFLDFMRVVGAVNRSLLAVGDAVAATAGLSHARAQCLQQLTGGPLTVAAVAARLDTARQGVQRVADLLVHDGLAVYVGNPRHRRAKLLTLTDAGRRALDDMAAAHRRWVDHAAVELSPLGLAELTEGLRAAHAALAAAPRPA
jgi:DNA-binding MarR family transcriptional regulator